MTELWTAVGVGVINVGLVVALIKLYTGIVRIDERIKDLERRMDRLENHSHH